MKRFFVFLLPVFIIILCSNRCKNQYNKDKNLIIESVKVDKDFNYLYNKDNYKIKDIQIKDSILTLFFIANVCSDDNIELVYNGLILKSFPPKVQLGIRYNENNKCKNNEIKRCYNINFIKQKNTNKIILLFPDYQPIEYTY